MHSKGHVEDLHWEVLVEGTLYEVVDPNAVIECSDIPEFGNSHKTCCHPSFHPKGTSKSCSKAAAPFDVRVPESMLFRLPITDNKLPHFDG